MKLIFACLLLQASITVFADPAPFGLEIGKATLADVEKTYSIEQQTGVNKYSKGPVYKVPINQVNFDGLEELKITFNEKGVFIGLEATLQKSQLKSLHESLSKKYKVVSEDIPSVGNSFVEYLNGSTSIFLVAPHMSFEMRLIYANKEFLSGMDAQLQAEAAAKKKSQEDKL
ncbi:MAG: hypothetical protein NTV43_16090 [Methylococcales bacterium]|nr:hypothetical protein [Methylococcales bacterium]